MSFIERSSLTVFQGSTGFYRSAGCRRTGGAGRCSRPSSDVIYRKVPYSVPLFRWLQAHWRRGEALSALQRFPEAVATLAAGRQVAAAGDTKLFDSRLWREVQRLTREQVPKAALAF
eukprot:4122270-Pyramimonas_sp.AAC.1